MAIDHREDWESLYRDSALSELPWHSERPSEHLIKLVNSNRIRKGRALDVCSGAGVNSVYLAKKGFEVTGIDISKTAVELSRKRAQKAGVTDNCSFVWGDVLTSPLPKDRFDFIFDRGCYHHMPPEAKAEFVRRVCAALKSGGRYLLTCFSDSNPESPMNVSKKEILGSFSGCFAIDEIVEQKNVENSTGGKHDFYVVLMTKR